mgnify:FL=1
MIRFYQKNKPFYEFSNFYSSPIVVDGKSFATVEHYYQASKFKFRGATKEELARFEYIRQLGTPLEAFREGRKKVKGLRIDPNWDDMKDNVMRKGVFRKFVTHEKLRNLLLSTENKEIIEDSPRDGYWGIMPKNGKPGLNMLGIILQEVRYLLSSSSVPQPVLSTKSHWIIPRFLLSSAYPQSFDELKKVDVVVTLQEDKELEKFRSYRKTEVKFNSSKRVDFVRAEKLYVRFSIPDRKSTDDLILDAFTDCCARFISKKLRFLVHCFGGKGRTGLVVSIILGKVYGMNSKEALDIISRLFSLYRQDKGGKGPPSMPQTKEQYSSVRVLLG